MSLFNKSDILIPDVKDFSKWSVVACDQYTSQPEYWKGVSEFVGDAPSTLNLVYPEAFLSEGDSRIEKINKTIIGPINFQVNGCAILPPITV